MSVSVCQLQTSSSSYSYPLQLAFSIGGGGGTTPSGTGSELLRKRTTSFSCPAPSSTRPRKRLHRTESIVDLTAIAATASTMTPLTTPPPVPYQRTLKFYKEQKDRRRAALRRDTSPIPLDSSSSFRTSSPALSFQTKSRATPPSIPVSPAFSSANSNPARIPLSTPVHSTPTRQPKPPTSPLARFPGTAATTANPQRALVLPTPPSSAFAYGPAHPPPPCAVRSRSKPRAPVDLHRRALTACMRATPEGAKILHMGARLAVGIMAATRELERLCGEDVDVDAMGDVEEDVAAAEADADVPMPDADLPMVSESELEPEFEAEPELEPAPEADSESESESEPEPEPVMSASWVVVGGRAPVPVLCGREIVREYQISREREDWEMVAVECVT